MVRTGIRRVLAIAIGGLSVLAIATGAGASAATKAATATVVSSATNPKLGAILVADRTVYTLKPSKTACTTACLKAWPPVLLPHGTKTPTAGTGVDASKLGTVKAPKGSRQITYNGKRLYWYAKDTAPGQVHGNRTDKWGKWATVTAATAVAAEGTTTTPAPTTVTPETGATAETPAPLAAPETEAPAETAPPATAAPAQTAPPATQSTNPPKTDPPATSPPGNGGVGF